MQYEFNIFNVTNTTSLDVPQNQTQIRAERRLLSHEATQSRTTTARRLPELRSDRHQQQPCRPEISANNSTCCPL